MMVAPTALANRLLSVFRILLMHVIPAFTRKCCARSDTPFSVNTKLGFNSVIFLHIFSIYSSSICNNLVKSPSFIISTLV
uniref:Putative secreted protein n=1 Tax=Panstrongylus lignarius TaxID=156445 RepID=A0A224Y3C5_9HEMI